MMMKEKQLKGKEYLYYGELEITETIVIPDPNDNFPDKYYQSKEQKYKKVSVKKKLITKAAYNKHNRMTYSSNSIYNKVYRVKNTSDSLYMALNYFNEKAKKSDLKNIIETALECIEENKLEIMNINSDRRYTDEYKKELMNKYVKENEFIEMKIREIESLLFMKDNSKKIAKLNKAKRELTKLEKEKWKMSDVYYNESVDNILIKYPEFSKEELCS